ncbi:hypothetical protein CCMSSC00406_0002699 [Pleurotus cornucopiae]|uniref:Uncharacterized protein n=1 Tax=Pleurotus cornucopiae TaxID=5321 RepID=A0ACB7IXA7_PLECO|nr:hypothetical protein CCMSSC00406_0002699 [Pleurotus cornucopiae]
MTADTMQTFGFPPGYFIVRSIASNRLLDVTNDDVEDGTEIVLWPEKDSSLVESRRSPEANNQVFFIDPSGALCARSSGHAIDIEDDRLVLRHRRPVSLPFPNKYSHPLPRFFYDTKSGEITVQFEYDPTYPPTPQATGAWRNKTYVLASIPMRKPRTIIDDASEFLTSAVTAPLSLFGLASPKPTPEEVYRSDIDIGEDEVVEEERGEEAEVDDSPEDIRKVRMLALLDKETSDRTLGEKARNRRRWQVAPLRTVNARTAA